MLEDADFSGLETSSRAAFGSGSGLDIPLNDEGPVCIFRTSVPAPSCVSPPVSVLETMEARAGKRLCPMVDSSSARVGRRRLVDGADDDNRCLVVYVFTGRWRWVGFSWEKEGQAGDDSIGDPIRFCFSGELDMILAGESAFRGFGLVWVLIWGSDSDSDSDPESSEDEDEAADFWLSESDAVDAFFVGDFAEAFGGLFT